MSIKISIIGAGSAVFSINLINDICLTPTLRDSTICFMDIDRERLETAYLLCKRFAEKTGIALNLEMTMDRAQAIRGADFVINTALAGDYGRLREGWKIARGLGYRFGGSLHIIHDEAFWINFYQLSLMRDIAEDILKYSPQAWYVLVANPVQAGVTWLKRTYPALNIVGMCHGFGGVYSVARTLGLVEKDVSFECPGVNHFVWLTKFYYRGRDAFPLLDAWIEEKAPGFHTNCWMSCHEGPKPVDLYKKFGAFPIGDTANPGGGSWGWWYHSDDETEKRWREDGWTWYEGYFNGCTKHVRHMHDVACDKTADVAEVFPKNGSLSSEPMIPLIEGLAVGPERTVIVNIQNDGEYVPGVPRDYEVEIAAVVSKKGIQGIKTEGLPRPILAHLLRDRVAPVEMELKAFETGNRQLLVDLIMMDPWTRSRKQAEELIDAIFALPYHEEMRKHFGS
jgi:alpha-galactosidase